MDWLKQLGSTIQNLFAPKVISPVPDRPDYVINFAPYVKADSPSPSPVPFNQYTKSVSPVTPQNIPSTWYTNRNQQIEPVLWDSIMKSGTDDYNKRMMLALGTQESSGGYMNSGDRGRAVGPYHIRPDIRSDINVQQASDPDFATQYLLKEILRNISAGALPSEGVKSWNSRSVNPDYSVDIPQMATTSSFYRGT